MMQAASFANYDGAEMFLEPGMNGQLSEHPLAELISEIAAKNLSGALRITRRRVKAVVYFDSGELTYAAANLRAYRLSEYLQKRALASTKKIAETKPAYSDSALAAALLSDGVLTREALDATLNEQVADVLRLLLLWTDGEWHFDNRARLSDDTRVAVPIRQLLIESVRRMELQFAKSRLQNRREKISPVHAAPDGLSLSPTEGFLLSRVEAPLAVRELTALSGMREPDALRTIYGLVVAGFLQREFRPHAFKTAAGPASARAEEIPVEAPSTSVVNQSLAPEPSVPERDPKQELNEFLEQLGQATNHYEVLRVSLSADVAEIRRAYHALARRFHPDRFHELAGTSLHTRLESAFARITQANEALADPDLRATYDAKLAALRRVRNSVRARPWGAKYGTSPEGVTEEFDRGGSDTQLAEKSFQEGLAALQLGHTNVAISCLSAAARVAPDQPKFRAFYGRALASNQKTRRLAEVELQAAIKLDAGNASYRVMLAALYRDLGFHRRALAELERALSLDAQNGEAREMLRTLELNKP
jgi:curved DNA-binding protein CbpA